MRHALPVLRSPGRRNSFETLALVLVDNAVKYSKPGESVNVSAIDAGRGVKVSVESKGLVIPVEESEQILREVTEQQLPKRLRRVVQVWVYISPKSSPTPMEQKLNTRCGI